MVGLILDLFVRPEVVHGCSQSRWIANVGPSNADRQRPGAAIEENDGTAAVGELARPDLDVAILLHTAAGLAERILVDGDDSPIEKDRFGIGIEIDDVQLAVKKGGASRGGRGSPRSAWPPTIDASGVTLLPDQHGAIGSVTTNTLGAAR